MNTTLFFVGIEQWGYFDFSANLSGPNNLPKSRSEMDAPKAYVHSISEGQAFESNLSYIENPTDPFITWWKASLADSGIGSGPPLSPLDWIL